MRIECDRIRQTISIDQEGYINQVIRGFRMGVEKGVRMPIQPVTSLLHRKASPTIYSEREKVLDSLVDKEEESGADQRDYQEIVGGLNYAAIATQPDISFAIGVLGRFAVDPAERHMTIAVRVMR